MLTSLKNHISTTYHRIANIGVEHVDEVITKQRLIYFNSILLSLPIVYTIFVIKDIVDYLIPLDQWALDQWSFFVFIGICLLCFLLNHKGYCDISKILFLILWPLILHILPIIIMQVPSDYYYAFPAGIMFHSLMIQALYSWRTQPWSFVIYMTANFFMMWFFLDILQYYDTDNSGELKELTSDSYYVLVVFLYWLLFNMVNFYLLGSIDRSLSNLSESHALVEQQKSELEAAFDELNASKEKLVESEKLASLGVFTAGIAHNLNNPLNYISSGSTILAEMLGKIKAKLKTSAKELKPELDEVDRSFDAIRAGVKKSTEVIQSLSNYTRKNVTEFVPYNLVQCVEDAILLFPESFLYDINIEKELPDEIEIKCNPSRISQVLIILIQNAIDACTDHGTIRIKAYQKSAKRVVLEVSDNGKGIDEENLKRVFDPFYSTKENSQTAGLGLYVAYGIMTEHKGKIGIASEVNQGTTVTLTFRN